MGLSFLLVHSSLHSLTPFSAKHSLQFGFIAVSIMIHVTGGRIEPPTSQGNYVHSLIPYCRWSHGLLISYFHINVYNFYIPAGTYIEKIQTRCPSISTTCPPVPLAAQFCSQPMRLGCSWIWSTWICRKGNIWRRSSLRYATSEKHTTYSKTKDGLGLPQLDLRSISQCYVLQWMS